MDEELSSSSEGFLLNYRQIRGNNNGNFRGRFRNSGGSYGNKNTYASISYNNSSRGNRPSRNNYSSQGQSFNHRGGSTPFRSSFQSRSYRRRSFRGGQINMMENINESSSVHHDNSANETNQVNNSSISNNNHFFRT
jgi:hypothetical protein